jgi:oxygen-independent coproporphyrinogen-3 oxidase
MDKSSYKKYNQSVPRYTSYPPLPNWGETPTEGAWMNQVKRTFEHSNSEHGISLYIHLPFCESLCTYCACNKRITKNHAVEIPYIEAILKEWSIYKKQFNQKPIIKELHFGGGTPTFFNPESLGYLLKHLFEDAIIPEVKSYSFEGHPANTTKEHLETLANYGFDRMSLGIQDMDFEVQKAINRFQTKEEIANCVNYARELGFTSINFDIIYGLPFQKLCSLPKTMELLEDLRPERIAFYGYAHVPWVSKVQRKYKDSDVPVGSRKRMLYDFGKSQMLKMGYKEFGMDHFALETDELYHAYLQKKLHRNFMGYTIQETELLIGLGCSSISDANHMIIQNEKSVEEYQKIINEDHIPIIKGHTLSDEDLRLKKVILELLSQHEINMSEHLKIDWRVKMNSFILDGLVVIVGDKLKVTENGEPFIRTICAAIDPYMENRVEGMFSRAV